MDRYIMIVTYKDRVSHTIIEDDADIGKAIQDIIADPDFNTGTVYELGRHVQTFKKRNEGD